MLRSDKKSKRYYLQLKGISKFIYVFFIINYVIPHNLIFDDFDVTL